MISNFLVVLTFEMVGDDLRRVLACVSVLAAKSGRYVAEMREIAATQSAAGLPAELFEAIAACYASIAETPLAASTPEQADAADDLVAVLEGLRR